MRPRKTHATVSALVGVLAVAAWSGPAFACTVDAECDDGVMCAASDTCQLGVCVPGGGGDGDGDAVCDADDNCLDVANPSQQDLDGVAAGDACDDDDVDANLVQVRLKRSINAAKPNGGIVAKGDFLRLAPEPPIAVTGGFVVHVEAQVGLNATYAFAEAECVANAKGRIKCKSTDKTRQLLLQPAAKTNLQNYRFSFKVGKLNLTGPFFMPVRLTITNAPAVLEEGIDREGTIVDCKQSTLGMVCKE